MLDSRMDAGKLKYDLGDVTDTNLDVSLDTIFLELSLV